MSAIHGMTVLLAYCCILLHTSKIICSDDASEGHLKNESVLHAMETEEFEIITNSNSSLSSPLSMSQVLSLSASTVKTSTFLDPDVESEQVDTANDTLPPFVPISVPGPDDLSVEQMNDEGDKNSASSVTVQESAVTSPKTIVIREPFIPIFIPVQESHIVTLPPILEREIVFLRYDKQNGKDFYWTLGKWQSHVCGQKGLCSTEESYPCEIRETSCSPCRCDQDCFLYRDCCLDKYRNVTDHSVIPLPPAKEVSCVTGALKGSSHVTAKSYYMVDYCPKWNSSGHIEGSSPCETTTDLSYPVYSPTTDTHYKNMQCASCNRERNVIKWRLKLICQTVLNYSKITTPKSFFDETFTNEQCNMLFLPPENITARECTPVEETTIDSCPPEYEGEQVREACGKYLSPVQIWSKVYKNVLCALCNGRQFPRQVDAECDFPPRIKRDILNPTSVLPDYDRLVSVNSPTETNLQCPQNEIFDPNQERCRTLFCAPGKVVTNNTCLNLFPSARALGYTLYFALLPDSPQPTGSETIQPRDIFSRYREYVDSKLSQTIIGYESSDISLGHTMKGAIPSLEILNITVTMHIIISAPIPRETLETSLIDFVVNGWYYYATPNDVPLIFKAVWLSVPKIPFVTLTRKFKTDGNHTVENIPSQHFGFSVRFPPVYYVDPSSFIIVSEVLQCKMVELTPDEFDGDTKQLITVKETGKTLQYGQFILGNGGGVRICTDLNGDKDYRRSMISTISEHSENNAQILKLPGGPEMDVTLACCTISQIFLLLAFLVNILRSGYRDVSGLNSMAFIANVFCLQLFYQLSICLDSQTVACITFAAIIHYFWLSSMLWLLAIVLHVYRVLLVSPLEHNGRAFRGWLWAIGQALPALILGIYIVINISLSNDVGYEVKNIGLDVCFISSVLALALSFLSPIGIVLCLSFCLHGRIRWSVRGKKEENNQLMESYINLSMSYLTITLYLTLTWILTTLAYFTDMSFVFYFSLLLHAGIGILVFVSMGNYKTGHAKQLFKPRINSDAVFYSVGEPSPATPISDNPPL